MILRSLAVLVPAFATMLVPATAHADKSYTDIGDQVLRIRLTKSPGLLALTHTSETNFIATTVNSSGKQEQLLANEIGLYRALCSITATAPPRASLPTTLPRCAGGETTRVGRPAPW
ncbi:hypothetical protein ACQP2T_06470 [Nonomuraea sp. CA-143628]|uniref:hypothetical protein n=1 Tax=Nonomuraea sp. CA-143628 TaxID=3239997 RepID=UPI003D914231